MKVYAISDLHLSINNPKPMDIFGASWDDYLDKIILDWNKKVNDNDIILISGDISWAMYLEDAKPDLDFIANLKGHKIIIRGNHDYWWKSISAVRGLLTNKTYAVQNDSLKIGNYVIAGSRGWTVPENNLDHKTQADKTIFDRELIRMRLSLEDACKKMNDTDKLIVMIHYPPFNLRQQESSFTKLFDEFNVDSVVYGHLHGHNCKSILKKQINNTIYYLSSCDLVGNELVEIY